MNLTLYNITLIIFVIILGLMTLISIIFVLTYDYKLENDDNSSTTTTTDICTQYDEI